MKNIICMLFCLFLSSAAMSWTAEGHVLISDLAVDNLSPAKSRELERIARTLETTFEIDRRLYLLNTYRNASDLAKIAAFPDRIRDLTLSELFSQWQLQVPEPLAHLAASDTRAWHYKNQPYYTGADEAPQCDLSSEVNIASIYPLLLQSYAEAEEDVAKAILLAFIIHFVADAHQPLHGLTRVDQECNHDLGGNSFCATERGFADRCNMNLHALWDGGVGLFDYYDTYDALYQSVEGNHADIELVEVPDMDVWLQENYLQARYIYTLREDRDPDDIYRRDGQHTSLLRIIVAADRLGLVLEEL
jgi:hypothetical protein